MKNIFKGLLNVFDSDKEYWLEVKTSSPSCVYYFGPFTTADEASIAQSGYVEDLEREGAQGVQAQVQHCKRPEQLTVYDDSTEGARGGISPLLIT